MKKLNLPTINNTLYFAKSGGFRIPLGLFEETHGFAVDGSNDYIGINSKTMEYLPGHMDYLRGLKKLVESGKKSHILAIVALEPDAGLDYVKNNYTLIKTIAQEINSIQEGHSDKLKIIIRYASEMNVKKKENPWSSNPDDYKKTYIEIKKIFQDTAPGTLFNFSPNIRYDLHPDGKVVQPIEEYWPGNGYVDIISCTWYIGSKDNAFLSTDFFNIHYQWAMSLKKPFAVDELGGRDKPCSNELIIPDNSERLIKMMEYIIRKNQESGASSEYITLFLEKKWNVDLDLFVARFLAEEFFIGSVRKPVIRNIEPDRLPEEARNAFRILANLDLGRFNHIKTHLALGLPDIIGPQTVDVFTAFLKDKEFDLTQNGINTFKEKHKLGNTGSSQGIIGEQTAAEYYEELLPIIDPSPAIISSEAPPDEYEPATVVLQGGMKINLPQSVKVCREAHLVTDNDTKFSNSWPKDQNDGIEHHYELSEKASGYAMTRSDIWCPAEGGGLIGQGSRCVKPPPEAEAWYFCMNWKNPPLLGTRMIVKNPSNGRKVVAAAGYETGPSGYTGFLGGACEEIHHYLGSEHGDTLEVGFARNQSLKYGPL